MAASISNPAAMAGTAATNNSTANITEITTLTHLFFFIFMSPYVLLAGFVLTLLKGN
jgi:hypothetical protein